MTPELEARFEAATKEVTTLSKAPDQMTKLRLYTLFKQGSVGDCTGARPGMTDFVGRAKYDAWKALEGTARADAMAQYIGLVAELKAADAG